MMQNNNDLRENRMANQLVEQLSAADRICTQAYPFFEKAAYMRVDAETAFKKGRKASIWKSVGLAVVFACVASALLSLLRAGVTLAELLAIALGIFLHKAVFMARLRADHEKALQAANIEEARGTRILEDNAQVLSIIPNDYWYPMATGYLLKVVQTGRAYTVNQALQMYDEQLHRWKMEESSSQILAQQQAQTEALKGIRKSSAINAAANVMNAAANISRWF